MRTSKYPFFVNKKHYKNKIISNELMLRSGLIRKISSGIYSFLPLGVRIINKITKIIKVEMEKNNSIEILMPVLQPISLWKNSNREKIFGKELFKLLDRKKKKFILSPTNEEIITYILSKEIKSYKNLPIIFYQIQNKYRDEIRPRAGIIRCKEFIMKDAYSFHKEEKSLQKTYLDMYNSYTKIFSSLKIKFYTIKTESKKMGGKISHEFHSVSKNGENYILTTKNYNIAKKISITSIVKKEHKKHNLKYETYYTKIFLIKIDKYKNNIIIIIHENSNIDIKKIKKYFNNNLIKFEKKNKIEKFYKKISDPKKILKIRNKIIIDKYVLLNKNFYIRKEINKIENIKHSHYKENLLFNYAYNIKKSIEIAHIFKIGKKYSKKNNFFIIDQKKNKKFINMGCYGIGITRLIPSIIEQNYDKNGIIWPKIISPFEIIILPINKKKYPEVENFSKTLYKYMKNKKIEVLIDDREISPGKMFFEADLIGITHIVIVSMKNVKNKIVEYRNRKSNKTILVSIDKINKIFNK
ncbi:proline--tRNA ligase [Buchnera aphidicola (Chaitoregma tattakana)]|uniref:proline--tRNA ligase n=1 Tax=Buchnera aphidicola TaxID=9 RepID=UPI0031B893C4